MHISEWCEATEHVIDELSNSLFSISEPRWSSKEDSERIKLLKRKVHDFMQNTRLLPAKKAESLIQIFPAGFFGLKALGLLVLFILVFHQTATASGPWFVSTYTGAKSPRTYGEILHKSWNLQSEYLAAASVGREMTRLDRVFGIEADLAVEWE